MQTTLLSSEDTAKDLAATSYIALNTAYQYCHDNDLVVNPTKTKQVAFGMQADKVHSIPDVELSEQAKFLGIIVDSKLTRTPHLDGLCQKLSSSLYSIKSVKEISDTKPAITAYHPTHPSPD
uniref:Reverse transcriptase domain-containing protein n=1 Tax=Cuerna arida TaxID=1464854 RepID=A0A1B6G027_9HEMI